MALVMLGGTAFAADESVTVTAPAVKAAPIAPVNPTTTVACRYQDPPLGSHLGAHKSCKTLGEWKQIQANAQMDMEQMQFFHDEKYQQDLNAAGGGH